MTIKSSMSQDVSTSCNFSTTEFNSGAEHVTSIQDSFSASAYRKSYIAWDKLERANKPDNYTEKTKYLSKNAKALLSVVYQKLKRQPVLLLNHKYISTITGAGSRQNQNVINELNELLNISYHRSAEDHKGKKYEYVYKFTHKKVHTDSSGDGMKKKISVSITPSTYIDKNNIINNRSRANFVKNSFGSFSNEQNSKFKSKNEDARKEKSLENKDLEQSPEKLKETIATPTANTNGFLGSGKYLHEVLDHLTDEMCSLIRTKCGKDFTNRAIREIAGAVSRSKKGAKAFFYHIKGLIAYLAKVLTYEKRDPVKISSTNYYITANQTDSEREMREQEKYLTDIEYSLQVSPEWHLKKKIAATLQRSKAYNILTSWKNLEITKEGVAKLSLTKPIFLTEIDKKIILSQIKATHERVGGARCNSAKNDEGVDAVFVDSLEIEIPERGAVENSNQEANNPYNQTVPHTRTEEPPKREGVWGKIRETFASYLPQGDAIDKSWTAKLEAKIDESSNTIHLQAPSVFIRDWIENNYKTYIERASLENGFELRGMCLIPSVDQFA